MESNEPAPIKKGSDSRLTVSIQPLCCVPLDNHDVDPRFSSGCCCRARCRSRGKLKEPIGPDTKLFQDGLIDSFGLVELQADLEKKSGKPFLKGSSRPTISNRPGCSLRG